MMALTMSLVALAIDTMLPAHGLIGEEMGVQNINDTQFMVYMLFIGLGFGQLLFGPMADSFGRLPSIYLGLAIFVVGTVISLFSQTFEIMLAGRLLQGIGVAGPRIITVAIVRDLYAGRQMASVMSFIMSIFILVPAIAPALGQGIMLLSGWRTIFWTFLALAAVIAAWFAVRQPETLRPADRQTPDFATLSRNTREVLSSRIAMGYTLAAALISGAFVGFLATAQQILQVQYELGVLFPAYFAPLAFCVGASTLTNGKIVMRFGMRALATNAAMAITLISGAMLVAASFWQGTPPLWMTMAGLMSLFLFIGFVFGNLNALAMEPMGRIAGTASAAIGALTTLISSAIAVACGAFYNDTIYPLTISFFVLGMLSTLVIIATDRTTASPA